MQIIPVCLPEHLHAQLPAAADQAETSVQDFILQAIAEKLEGERLDRNFLDLADERYANIATTGKTIPWDQMRSNLQKRMSEK